MNSCDLIPPLFTIAVAVVAVHGGLTEAKQTLVRQLAGDRRELNHRKLTQNRIGVLGAAVMIAIALDFRWAAIAYVPLCMTEFAMLHRLTMNTARDLPSCYVASGNAYDLWFLRRVTGWGAAILKDVHRAKYHANTGGYADMVHRAGAIMYISEASVLIASILILTLTNTN